MKKRLAVLLLLCLALFCAPGLRNHALAAPAPQKTATTLSQSSKSLTLSTQSATLTRYSAKTLALYQQGKNVRSKATWTTSNSKVATVKSGVVTAKGFGTCTITAKKNGYRATCKVTVKPGQCFFRWVQKKSPGKVSLCWKQASGVSGYQLYRSTSKTGVFCRVKTFSKASTTSYTNTVTRNKTYYYKLRSYYKTDSGVYIYSSWSDIQRVKA